LIPRRRFGYGRRVSNARNRPLALLAALAALATAVLLWRTTADDAPAAHAPPPVAAASPPPASAPPVAEIDPAPASPAAPTRAPEPAIDSEAGEDGDLERALRWSSVDLDALRREIPDNLYWEMGAPTDDPDVLEERARERARWNDAWGRVLSGNATEEEIHAYFDHRHRLSTDYLAFASLLLDRHREVLPERDVGLLELSVRMHHKRLQELPRDLAEALERKERQDALREAWLRDEARLATPTDDAP
jgi:hypothetical protein